MRTLSVGNQKGGVGKTTITVHLAHYAAERGSRVLIVDMDEGDVAEAFGLEQDQLKGLQASALFNDEDAAPVPMQIQERIALVSADVGLLDVDDMDLEVIRNPRRRLARFQATYDLCIIDTPPNLQRRMIGALACSDALVAPFTLDAFALARMPKLERTVEHVQTSLNPGLRMLGYLPNRLNSRSKNEMESMPELLEHFGDSIIDSPVMERSAVKAALAAGKPVWGHTRTGNGQVAAREMKAACAAIFKRFAMQLTQDRNQGKAHGPVEIKTDATV